MFFRTPASMCENTTPRTVELTNHHRHRTCPCKGHSCRTKQEDLAVRRSTESRDGCGTNTSLTIVDPFNHKSAFDTKSVHIPVMPLVLNRYVKEFPVVIGHWLTKAPPSAQFVVCCRIPCQCCRPQVSNYQSDQRRGLTILVGVNMEGSSSLSWTSILNSSPYNDSEL